MQKIMLCLHIYSGLLMKEHLTKTQEKLERDCLEHHCERSLTLLRMGFFAVAHECGGKKALLPKICHTYPTMMKLCTFIPYT